MKIGELSRRTHVSARMLRYCEDEKRITPTRSASGYRDYSRQDEQVAKAIRLLNEVGLKLDFIRRFLPCLRSEGPILHPCPGLISAVQQEMKQHHAQVAKFRKSRKLLDGYHKEVRQEA